MISIKRVLEICAEVWGVPIAAMTSGDGRERDWVDARRSAACMLREHHGIGSVRIGRHLGMDQSTVSIGMRQLVAMSGQVPRIKRKLDEIQRRIEAETSPARACPWADPQFVERVVAIRRKGYSGPQIAALVGVGVAYVAAVLRETEGAGA